jgi:hypothetical protein
MSGFDAEWYLRRLGEDMLLGPVSDHSGQLADLKHATAALVAVGAIEPELAGAVVDDYGIAHAARQGLVEFVLVSLARNERAASLTPPPGQRVVGLDDQIELPEGTLRLRYATLDEHHTAVSAVYRPHGARRYSGHGWLGTPSGLPPALSNAVLADDQGNTASLEFSGSGSDYRWELTLTPDQPLATDTTWLELAGRRIRLLDRPSGLTVQIEPLSEADPAHRHLWRQVALSADSPREHGLGASIDALTAAGALDRADPVIKLVHWVGEGGPGRVLGAWRAGVVRDAPEPRQAPRQEGRTDGPKGTIFVGAITPEFDRHFAAAYYLESKPDGFSIEAAVSPPDSEHHPGLIDVEDRALVWWARDDRGNHHLGHWEGSRADEAIASGTIAFSSALDPLAERLELLPTGPRARAVISFPLRWDGEAR